ncbi:MAG: DUF3313 domain-containing protein [Piscirickettsiaceae bacterium]|nr:DUF3313 domain-containing protein [Piscirickettsiaceae bacterium]
MNILKLSNILMIASMALFAVHPVSADDPERPQSAFIEGKIDLSPIPDKQGAYRYIKPDLDLKKYSKIIIEPVEVWLHPESKYKGIEPNTVKAMADSFAQILVNELEPEYRVVGQVGDDTLVVRLAIMGLKTKKKKRGLLGYIPVALIVSALNTDALERVSLIDAGIEAEILDSITGERLAVLVDTGIRTPASDTAGKKLSWEDIEMSLRFYAKRFKSQLDASK